MKRVLQLACLFVAITGCGGPVARLDRMSRVEAAVLKDANALAPDMRGTARPPIQLTDPDRLAALEAFLKARRGQWQKVSGTPRATRFQLELIGNERPLYTLWLEPGYLAMAEGKAIREARLSNAETAELLACLGLPPDYLNAGPMMPPGVSPIAPAGYSQPGYPPPAGPMPQGVIPAGGAEPGPGSTGASRLF